jgi:hypothetical protein
MASIASYHSKDGSNSFLGLRRSVRGNLEIVFDQGRDHQVFRLAGQTPQLDVIDAMCRALTERRIVPALMAELTRRDIKVTQVAA